jgi:hypothetical protein
VRIKDSVRAARQRHGQPMDRAEVKRSVRGEEVASTFPITNTRSHLLASAPALSRAHGCPGDWKPKRFYLVGRCRAYANPRVVLPAAFSRPPSRRDPCSLRPPLLHCFCADDPASVACSCRERQCPSKRQASNIWTWLKNVSAL